MKRYASALIVLHWMLAILVLLALVMGNDIAALSNDLDLKVDRLTVHSIAGLLIGLFFTLRLIVKRLKPLNAPKEHSSLPANKLAAAFHHWLYLLVFSVVLSGIAIAVEVDMLTIVRMGDTMPESLGSLGVRQLHGLLTQLLGVSIALHVIAALYHQWVLKDRLFSRMWFGKQEGSK